MFQISKVISYSLDKNILFDKFNYGENILILYDDAKSYKQILQNFVKQMALDNPILLYFSHTTNLLNFGFKVKNFSFNIINENIIHELKLEFDKHFNKMEKQGKEMILIADWSKTNLNNCEIFLPFLENLIKKSWGLTPDVWKKKYKIIRQKTPLMLINVFDIKNLDEKFIKNVIKLHQRVCLIQENTNTFLLPTISPSSETIFPKYHILPQRILEKIAKDNLTLIVLLLLENNNKSGYQLLKDIANHFHCILSQGTLYPLLYELEKKTKITKQNGKGREIVYSLTEETKKDLQSEKEILLNAYQHLASFFGGGGDNKIIMSSETKSKTK